MDSTDTAEDTLKTLPPELRYIGQMNASYLLCEDKEGLIVVDQHALHEKHEFERLMKDFREGPLEVQNLLVPKVITLEPESLPIIEEHQQEFLKLGIELEPFGDNDIAVKSRPSMLPEEEVEEVIHESLEWIRDEQKPETDILERLVRPILATVACHSVVRFNDRLDPWKAKELLALLPELQAGWTCPHGRPVVFRLPFKEIRKHFSRT